MSGPKNIRVLLNNNNVPDTPTLSVLSLSMRTVSVGENKSKEIVACSGIVYPNVGIEGTTASRTSKTQFVFSAVRDLENIEFTAKFGEALQQLYKSAANGGGILEIVKNEKMLITSLLSFIQKHDPDVIVGHNILGFDLGVLLTRMRICKVDKWSRIGRLNWSV